MKYPLTDPRNAYYSDVDFGNLMTQRIHKVLLLCSKYDAFVLEEDGRIDEQIFKEYVRLNLRYPPHFIHVTTDQEAFKALEEQNIDLIINMLSIAGMNPLELSQKIKSKYENIPLVLLTPMSREISLRLAKADLTGVDYVFSWLGHADLLLAIVKLVEDKSNADFDINNVGVQTIILVEDSIPFYSSYLPNIYKIMISQSKTFTHEGLNEYQKTTRLRGRPKILLARNYEEAWGLYRRFHHNVLGIISDISYPREGKRDDLAGLKLCRMVREEDRSMPFLLQSTNKKNEKYAKKLGAGFIHKNSKTMLLELRSYLMDHLAFGDFIFICPKTGKEVARAASIKELQEQIMELSDEVLLFHVKRDHFSKWLRARALFRIANMFRYVRPEHFKSTDDIRTFIYDSISAYRKNTGRGVIAKYYRKSLDDYIMLSRIGDGYIGGKARGLAFIDLLLKQNRLHNKFENVFISIPRTVVISTYYFDLFMEKNLLYDFALVEEDDKTILEKFKESDLPRSLVKDLKKYLESVNKPLAVRSSSLLEDSHYQPFAGIYSTYMLSMSDSPQKNYQQLADAIKSVYASVYFKDSKAYMTATQNIIDEEKMAIVLQEVCGKDYGDFYMPTFSGVARSLNFYPINEEQTQDGVVELAVGLGKHVVDGTGFNLRFSPGNPKKVLQLSSPDLALKETQKEFFALSVKNQNMAKDSFDDFNLVELPVRQLPKDKVFKGILSSYDFHNNMIRDSYDGTGKPLVTFSHILKYNKIPLVDIIKEMLRVGKEAMNNPVEIEFAVEIPKDSNRDIEFSMLQIRPIVESTIAERINLNNIETEEAIIVSNSSIGNGFISGVNDIVYVKPEGFEAKNNRDIVASIAKVNETFNAEKNYILIGPGRWGSKDQWLGIPVTWSQISHTRVIVESSLQNYHIDPSQGTHFFQNLTSLHVGYITVNPHLKDGFVDFDYLSKIDNVIYEDEFVRHVKLENDAQIFLDGKSKKAVIYKPNYKIKKVNDSDEPDSFTW